MSRLKDISKLRISSVTETYDAARAVVREVVEDEIERREARMAQGPSPNDFHTRSDIDLLRAWLNREERMVSKRRVYE